MVLRRRSDTELLPFRPIRPELAIPLVEPSSTSVADSDLDYSFLRRHMDRIPIHLLPSVQKPLVGSACICHGTRCPSLGTDPLEYLQYGSLPALGSRTDRKWFGRAFIMVVAGGSGCCTGRR